MPQIQPVPQAPATQAEICAELREIYEALLDQHKNNPGGPVEITIRGRTLRYPEPTTHLRTLREEIEICDRKVAAQSATTPARNRIRLRRDG